MKSANAALRIALFFVVAMGHSFVAWAEPTPADAAFWRWVVAHKNDLATIKRGDEPIANQLEAELHKLSPNLAFEFGINTKPRELIISAGGIRDAFPVVTRLVAAAPSIPGWKVIAFRQRKAGFTIELGNGVKLDGKSVMFVSRDHGETVDVVLHVSGGHPIDNDLKTAVYLLLDSTLGEYDVETRLGGIDIVGIAPPKTARPLAELAALVDQKKHAAH